MITSMLLLRREIESESVVPVRLSQKTIENFKAQLVASTIYSHKGLFLRKVAIKEPK
jgi:hypothetical protein